MPGKIAVVDDEDVVRDLLAAILEERGYEVSAFASIADARGGLAFFSPDLVIVDVQLPDGCGLDLVGSLWSEAGKRIPAIVLSGGRDERDIVRGFAAGAVDYLSKPFSREELLARCAVHLARTSSFETPNLDGTELPERNGRAFGRYEVLGELGRGGYGRVYLARDGERRDERVALKVLSPLSSEQPDARMRFIRETYALSSIQHPNVVSVHDVGCVQGRLYYAMEFVPGESLQRRLQTTLLDEAEARVLARELLSALAAVHAAGLLHRDVKPENVLLRGRRHDAPVLVDFGLAKRRFDHGVTEADVLVGTMPYLPPEIIRGLNPDARSDLFSLGLTLRTALEGREVFPHLQGIELLNAIARGPIPLPNVPLSPGFRAFLARLVAIDADDRYGSATEALEALAAIEDEPASSESYAQPLVDDTKTARATRVTFAERPD